MKTYTPTEAAYIAQGQIVAEVILRVSARNRATGIVEHLDLWTGPEQRQFTIGGQVRTCFPAAILNVFPIVTGTGVKARMQRIALTPLPAEIRSLFSNYDAGRAPVTLHRALFNVESGDLIAEPRRVFKGRLHHAPETSGQIGEEGQIEAALASSAIDLTQGLTLTRSDEVQRQRSDDRFYRHKAVTGAVRVVWGEKTHTPAASPEAGAQGNTNDQRGR